MAAIEVNDAELAQLRNWIRSQPGIVLDDPDLMRFLAEKAEGAFGENVVDLRGAALTVLDRRREELEQSNRSITRSSRQNFASARRIHEAVIPLLKAENTAQICDAVKGPVKDALQVDTILVLVEEPFTALNPNRFFGPIKSCHAGFAEAYFGNPAAYAGGRIRLRPRPDAAPDIYQSVSDPEIQSEALLPLSLLPEEKPGGMPDAAGRRDKSLMLLGSSDRNKFQPGMGTDLLEFFREAAECSLRRLAA